jgi:hypothetical protein
MTLQSFELLYLYCGLGIRLLNLIPNFLNERVSEYFDNFLIDDSVPFSDF